MSSRQADFVIVGGGSAGCVLAARISEDPAAQVVLLEAGGPGDAEDIRIPACSRNLFLSEYDWAFYSEPEPALKGRRVYQPRGRALGGSSATNMMVYMRGSAADYDEWAELGNRGWDYASVLPYFKRSEDNERGASHFHGSGGPLAVSDSRSRNALDRGRAIAVEVDAPDGRRTIAADREVILAAGAFQSPQLLMLSGIGPEAELRKQGIKVAHEMAEVGANLHDHQGVLMSWET